uniref:Uncharacterized protein n=1 Tax=Oryza punctata TaxID=4537 RepID=A0A0E0JXA2_ORYPU
MALRLRHRLFMALVLAIWLAVAATSGCLSVPPPPPIPPEGKRDRVPMRPPSPFSPPGPRPFCRVSRGKDCPPAASN